MEARAREVVLMVEEEVKRVERRMPSPLLSKSQEPLRMWRERDAHDKLAMVQGTHFHWINLCNLCDFNHFLICTHCDETNCSRLGQRNSCCSFTSRNLYSTASYLVSECLLLLEGYHVR